MLCQYRLTDTFTVAAIIAVTVTITVSAVITVIMTVTVLIYVAVVVTVDGFIIVTVIIPVTVVVTFIITLTVIFYVGAVIYRCRYHYRFVIIVTVIISATVVIAVIITVTFIICVADVTYRRRFLFLYRCRYGYRCLCLHRHRLLPSMFVVQGLHVCRMLSGVEELPRTLSQRDLLGRRPPRLNRNMSIAEMGATKYTAGGERGRVTVAAAVAHTCRYR